MHVGGIAKAFRIPRSARGDWAPCVPRSRGMPRFVMSETAMPSKNDTAHLNHIDQNEQFMKSMNKINISEKLYSIKFSFSRFFPHLL